jgi:hypothetical protein
VETGVVKFCVRRGGRDSHGDGGGAAGGEDGIWAKVQVASAGRPEQERSTSPAKPPTEVRLTW